MMHIDKNTYQISTNNHYNIESVKTQIVVATSLRKTNNHIIRLKHKDFGNTKRWNTYTISREGIIYQHYDNKYHSDFLGVKEGDKRSTSIVLENMGCLFQTSKKVFVNWLNEVCNENDVIKKEWLGYEFWETFPDIQIRNMILLCSELCEKFNIPKNFIDFQHYHKDIYKFKGIVFRGNYIEDSSDMSPLLNLTQLNNMIKNEKF